MKNNGGLFERIINLILFPNKIEKRIGYFIIVFMVPFVYGLVYFTGGIKYVYSHTMYIPILLMGILFKFKGGLFIAFIGGILLGPLMSNWIYRLFIFMMIGGLSGLFSDKLRKVQKEKIDLLSYHQESSVFLFNALTKTSLNETSYKNVFIFRVLNYQKIIDYLSINIYFTLWPLIEEQLKNIVLNSRLYQIDNEMFAFVFKDKKINQIKEEVLSLFKKSHIINGVAVYLDVVIGYSKGKEKLEALVSHASIASRHAELNHQSFISYENKQNLGKISFSLIAEMQKAIEDNQLFLNYQPIYDPQSNKIIGAEALIRWRHPVHGLLGPMMFIPMIEETQLINNMTEYVFKVIKNDMIDDIVDKNLFISINISTKNILNLDLIKKLVSDEMFTSKQREHVVFEITETILIERPNHAAKTMSIIKNSGVRLALDDFGTGYSSLSYLGKFPLDIVKIDKSFIDLFADKSIQKIVQTVVDLSHNLDYKVIAEGVETKYLTQKLIDLNCDYLQGFYFSKPKSTKDFKLLINSD